MINLLLLVGALVATSLPVTISVMNSEDSSSTSTTTTYKETPELVNLKAVLEGNKVQNLPQPILTSANENLSAEEDLFFDGTFQPLKKDNNENSGNKAPQNNPVAPQKAPNPTAPVVAGPEACKGLIELMAKENISEATKKENFNKLIESTKKLFSNQMDRTCALNAFSNGYNFREVDDKKITNVLANGYLVRKNTINGNECFDYAKVLIRKLADDKFAYFLQEVTHYGKVKTISEELTKEDVYKNLDVLVNEYKNTKEEIDAAVKDIKARPIVSFLSDKDTLSKTFYRYAFGKKDDGGYDLSVTIREEQQSSATGNKKTEVININAMTIEDLKNQIKNKLTPKLSNLTKNTLMAFASLLKSNIQAQDVKPYEELLEEIATRNKDNRYKDMLDAFVGKTVKAINTDALKNDPMKRLFCAMNYANRFRDFINVLNNELDRDLLSEAELEKSISSTRLNEFKEHIIKTSVAKIKEQNSSFKPDEQYSSELFKNGTFLSFKDVFGRIISCFMLRNSDKTIDFYVYDNETDGFTQSFDVDLQALNIFSGTIYLTSNGFSGKISLFETAKLKKTVKDIVITNQVKNGKNEIKYTIKKLNDEYSAKLYKREDGKKEFQSLTLTENQKPLFEKQPIDTLVENIVKFTKSSEEQIDDLVDRLINNGWALTSDEDKIKLSSWNTYRQENELARIRKKYAAHKQRRNYSESLISDRQSQGEQENENNESQAGNEEEQHEQQEQHDQAQEGERQEQHVGVLN